jgi:hypothetical protein
MKEKVFLWCEIFCGFLVFGLMSCSVIDSLKEDRNGNNTGGTIPDPMYSFCFEGSNALLEDKGAFILQQENEEGSSNISIVADPEDPTNHVRKYTVYSNDIVHGTYQRVEDKIYYQNWHAQMGREYWYGFRTLICSNEWPLSAVNNYGGDRWLIIAQWHDIPDNLYYGDGVQREEWKSPTLAIYVINGKYKVLYRTDPLPISVTNGSTNGAECVAFDKRSLGCPSSENWEYDWQGQIDNLPSNTNTNHRWWQEDMLADRNANRWVKWVFHVKWASDNTGLLEVWKDGNKIIDKHNYPTSYNDYAGPTSKMGIYRSSPYAGVPYNSVYYDRTFYLDEYRIGDSNAVYDTVVPRGGR